MGRLRLADPKKLPDRAIESLHKQLASKVNDLFPVSVQIESEIEFYKQSQKGTRFSCEMLSANAVTANIGGRRIRAISLVEPNRNHFGAWAGWREDWEKLTGRGVRRGKQRYSLRAAAWTFYFGHLEPEYKAFRAEWALCSVDPDAAAQPHWHIDPPLWLGESGPEISAQASYISPLEEIPQEGLQEIDKLESRVIVSLKIPRLHLGMGGWDHPKRRDRISAQIDVSHWHCTLQDVPVDIARWAFRTLVYVKGQVERYPLSPSTQPLT